MGVRSQDRGVGNEVSVRRVGPVVALAVVAVSFLACGASGAYLDCVGPGVQSCRTGPSASCWPAEEERFWDCVITDLSINGNVGKWSGLGLWVLVLDNNHHNPISFPFALTTLSPGIARLPFLTRL